MITKKGARALLGIAAIFASPAHSQTNSTYGTPGLVEVPTAESMDDGELSFTTSAFGSSLRNTLTFQVLPWVSGSFRYSVIDDFGMGPGGAALYDRSFDLHFQLVEETPQRPALALGFRDIIGTGIYSSEYLVATKTLRTGLSFSGGVGWGRLGGRGGITNPLGAIDKRFERRPERDFDFGGELEANSWFRGDMAFFGGVSWDVTDRLTLKAEYSPDLYEEETRRSAETIDSPWNLGLTYRFDNGVDLSSYLIGAEEIGVQISYTFDPRKRPVPGALDPAPMPLLPPESVAAASWGFSENKERGGLEPSQILAQRLADEGLALQGFNIAQGQATIWLQNDLWITEAQAAGRAARILANTLPPEIHTFRIVFQQNGMPLTAITTHREDLYELEHDVDGAWRTFARSEIEDAAEFKRSSDFGDAFPRFDYGIGPFFRLSLFDPDDPFRYAVGPEVFAAYQPTPGLTFAGTLSYPLISTIDDATRVSDSVLPRVRSDGVRYAKASELEVNQLTAEHLFRPGKDLFGRVTAGYLESMFGGVSAELLWYPVDSRFAFGVEANYARQRDYDMLFGFRDYDVITGHASAYYDFGSGFLGQVDVGRYLAGDWGATFGLKREFNNGFKIGAFFTLTDVPFDDFGEGSFDKGITLEIPFSWFTGRPTRATSRNTIRPVTRDGGARLDMRNRLYGMTRDYRTQELQDGWGRYLR